MPETKDIGKEAVWTPETVCSEPIEAANDDDANDPEAIDVTDNNDKADAEPEETDDADENTEDGEEEKPEEEPKDEKKEEKKETPVDYKAELEKAQKDFAAYKASEEARFKEYMSRNQQPQTPAANNDEIPLKSIFDDPARLEELNSMIYDKPAEFGKVILTEAVKAVKDMLRPTFDMANRFVEEEKVTNANKQINAFKERYAESGLKDLVDKVLTTDGAEHKAVKELIQTKGYTLDEAFEKVFHKQIVEEEARKLAASRKGQSISTPQGRPVPQSEKDKPKPKGIENIVRAVIRGQLK